MLIPVLAVSASVFIIPAQFSQTFLGAMKLKYDRLYSISEPKIVIIGGSSVPFGLDSALAEKALGMPVVDFGLYATLGTKLMLDMSRGAVNEGDIIIIAPETNKQLYSLFFNAESTWQSCDGGFYMLGGIRYGNIPDMFGGAWKFASQKLKYFSSGKTLDPEGVYNRSSFNEYGDIGYPRPYNIMAGLYDSSMEISFDTEIITDEFCDYVNEYVSFAKKKGASVYFSFCPMNEDAIDPDTTLEDLEAFVSRLEEKLDAAVISDPNSYIYRSGYFYDSNFHLNDAGVVLHTKTLCTDISEKVLGRDLLCDIEIPSSPEVPDDPGEEEEYGYDENEKYFTFKKTNAGYTLTGTTDEGKKAKTLYTPKAYGGERVYAVDAGAFNGCASLTDIYITDNITQLSDGAFSGAEALEYVHILATDPNRTTVNNVTGELTAGMAKGARFLCPKGLSGEYTTNYFWGAYADFISEEK